MSLQFMKNTKHALTLRRSQLFCVLEGRRHFCPCLLHQFVQEKNDSVEPQFKSDLFFLMHNYFCLFQMISVTIVSFALEINNLSLCVNITWHKLCSYSTCLSIQAYLCIIKKHCKFDLYFIRSEAFCFYNACMFYFMVIYYFSSIYKISSSYKMCLHQLFVFLTSYDLFPFFPLIVI